MTQHLGVIPGSATIAEEILRLWIECPTGRPKCRGYVADLRYLKVMIMKVDSEPAVFVMKGLLLCPTLR
jgi:hypothetical protein